MGAGTVVGALGERPVVGAALEPGARGVDFGLGVALEMGAALEPGGRCVDFGLGVALELGAGLQTFVVPQYGSPL